MRTLRYIAACLLGVVFLLGLAPSVHVHDAGELTAASWTLGIGHPPGAPFYMIAMKAFLLVVPFGSIAWRAGLFSAACAILAFLLFDALAGRLSGRRGLALAGACAFALSATFWSQAVMAEVYTLQTVLMLVFLLASHRSLLQEQCVANLRAAAFSWGLLLSCHAGLSPATPLVLGLLAKPEKPSLRRWAARAFRMVPAFLLPLSLYAYLPLRSLRSPPLDWGNPETPAALWAHLTNRQVRGRMLSLQAPEYWARISDYLEILWSNLHIFLPLSVLGLAAGWKRGRAFWALLAILLFSDAGFVVFLDSAPLASEAYAVPSVAILALLGILGASFFTSAHSARACLTWVLAAGIVSLGSGLGGTGLHGNFLVRDAASSLLQQVPRDGVLFVQEDNTTNALAYMVCVEGARPDLRIYDRFGNLFDNLYDRPLYSVPAAQHPSYRQVREEPAVLEALREGRPVFFSTPFLEYAPQRFHLIPGDYASRARRPGAHRPGPETPEPLSPRVGDRPDWMSRQILADLATRRIERALIEGAPSEAEPAIRLGLRRSDLPELFLRLGQQARRAGRTELAMEASRQALIRNPGFAPGLVLQGTLLFESGHREAAEHALLSAADLDPSLPQTFAQLGRIAASRMRWEYARSAFTRALELDPERADLLYDRALVALAMKDGAAAIRDLRAALRADPSLHAARNRIVSLYLDAGELPLAEKILCEGWSVGEAAAPHGEALKERLLLSARCGFPGCTASWMEGAIVRSTGERDLLEAYRSAARKAAAQHR